MESFDKLKYNRGYLITTEDVKPPQDHWKSLDIKEYRIFYDPLNEISWNFSGSNWVFILGNILDLKNFTSEKSLIVKELLRSLETSQDHFFDYIDELSGRFLILYGNDTTARILSDATGMRTIFYSKSKAFLGSHCALVQEYVNSPESTTVQREWLGKYTSQFLPGHFTPFEDIVFLTPNTLLDIKSTQVKRFFPREDIKELPTETVVEEISVLAKKQVELLSQKFKLLLSLTAGLDSRTTLSLLGDYKERFEFFTYTRSTFNESLDIDQEIAKEMAENLGLNHHFIMIDQDMKDKEFIELTKVLRRNTFSSHAFKLARIYLSKFSKKEHLHIRSNLYEIGRMYFKNNIRNLPKELTPESMSKIYSVKSVEDQKVIEAFNQYYNHVQMDKIFNYDPYDLFYWEYRMGTWHAQLLLESDIAHDTFILFNSRKILKLLLAVPETAKKENTVFYQLISKNWSVLDFWKINSRTKLTDYYDNEFDEFGQILKDIEFNSGSEENPNRIVPFKTKVFPTRLKFHIDLGAPKKGDYAEVNIPLKVKKDETNYCILQIRSPYERRKNLGRIHYEVLFDNQLLLREDIASWKESNQIIINWVPKSPSCSLTIRIVADRNCEDWNWGKIATLLIERVTTGVAQVENNFEVTTSSPYSQVYSDQEIFQPSFTINPE
ncbi:hypothetical protein [Mesobacillus maritimus]|uniref:hypothetical protein n=1 Tax=Mesobacillus maritimus TaxID=1643336 RepID=UPI003850C104